MHHSLLEISQAGLVTGLSSGVELRPFVRRRLSPEEGRAIEILGHAIEYLADEYCADAQPKGRLGNADPRIEAIQMLKALNRENLSFRGRGGAGIHTGEAVGDAYADALNQAEGVIVSLYAFRPEWANA